MTEDRHGQICDWSYFVTGHAYRMLNQDNKEIVSLVHVRRGKRGPPLMTC